MNQSRCVMENWDILKKRTSIIGNSWNSACLFFFFSLLWCFYRVTFSRLQRFSKFFLSAQKQQGDRLSNLSSLSFSRREDRSKKEKKSCVQGESSFQSSIKYGNWRVRNEVASFYWIVCFAFWIDCLIEKSNYWLLFICWTNETFR